MAVSCRLSPEAAHRYNSLLAVILGYSSHLVQRPDCPAEFRSALHHICEAAQKGRRLTADLLTDSGASAPEAPGAARPPLEEATGALAKEAARPAPGIWVVDDDPIFSEMCLHVLAESGHKVQVVNSSAAVRAAWKEAKVQPDLMIVDFSMPEGSGLELCRWLRQQGANLPVILVSGFSAQQPAIRKALELRRVYFLQKPFPVPELEDLVMVALGTQLLPNP